MEGGKYYFHKTLEKQDFDSFANEKDVVGIDNLGDEDDQDDGDAIVATGGSSY